MPIEAVSTRALRFVLGVIEVLVAVRFVLELFGANPWRDSLVLCSNGARWSRSPPTR